MCNQVECTNLTEEEFLLIPPRLVLKIFNVSNTQLWDRLPLVYKKRLDFRLEQYCWGHYKPGDDRIDGPSGKVKNCATCKTELLKSFAQVQ